MKWDLKGESIGLPLVSYLGTLEHEMKVTLKKLDMGLVFNGFYIPILFKADVACKAPDLPGVTDLWTEQAISLIWGTRTRESDVAISQDVSASAVISTASSDHRLFPWNPKIITPYLSSPTLCHILACDNPISELEGQMLINTMAKFLASDLDVRVSPTEDEWRSV